MKIIDLNEKYEPDYFVCLENWSGGMKEAGSHKAGWYRKMKETGLGVKIAVNEDDKPIGMIQYVPIERSFVEGNDLYFILCIWVHAYKNKGVGDNRKQGAGKSLLKAAEDDVRTKGAKGMAAWGVTLPVFMRASWFVKQGYTIVEKDQKFLGRVLLWKPFSEDALPPRWHLGNKMPELTGNKVTVTGLINGWCPAFNMTFERAKRASKELGENVVFNEINTFEPETFHEWGASETLFINNKKLSMGPPLSYKKLKKKISKEMKKLKPVP